jgi:hypothetical protein
MTDDRSTTDDLERRLRAGLRATDLPGAPASLADFLETVSDVPIEQVVTHPSGRAVGRTGRGVIGALGIAAALGVAGLLAFAVGSRPPAPALPPRAASETPAASPGSVGARITYEIAWTVAVPQDPILESQIETIVRGRLNAIGIPGATAAIGADGRLVVTVPLGSDIRAARYIARQPGWVAFVPLGQDAVEKGDTIDLAEHPPLFRSEGISGGDVGTNEQTGQRVLSFQLTPAASEAFESYTTTHVGDYLAIVFDDVVVSAPRIESAIPGGKVEISDNGSPNGWDLTEVTELVALIRHGPLPVSLREAEFTRSGDDLIAPDDPRIECEPPIDVGGIQLKCLDAIRAVIAILPAAKRDFSHVSFAHGCESIPESPGALVDCATQMSAIITVTLRDGTIIEYETGYDGTTRLRPDATGAATPRP